MRSWLAAAVFWTLLIMALCWLPIPMLTWGGDVGEHTKRFPHLDKVIHVGIFAVFGVLWMRALSVDRRFLIVLAAGVALAVITEVGQNLPIVGRDGELADGVFDVLGVLLAYPLALFIFRAQPAEPPLATATGG
jgi:VanZ family protein